MKHILLFKKIIFLALAELIFNFFSLKGYASDSDLGYVINTNEREIKIMSYNVQNLFDTVHDEGFQDFEFLPKSSPLKIECAKINVDIFRINCYTTDWTPDKLQIKLNNTAQAIQASGSLPDVLGLYEVENHNVVTPLMQSLGFDGFYITQGLDQRGIDNVVLFKASKLQPLEFIERSIQGLPKPTRNLSVAHFKIRDHFEKNAILAVYVNHWPSQGQDPVQTNIYRQIAAHELARFVEFNKKRYPRQKYYTLLMGDFNTLKSESPNPLTEILMPAIGDIYNVRDLSLSSNNPMNGIMPKASYYYRTKRTWHELDHIFVSSNLYDGTGFDVVPESFRIHAPQFLTQVSHRGEAIPFKYDHNSNDNSRAGYSDHFALVVKLKLK